MNDDDIGSGLLLGGTALLVIGILFTFWLPGLPLSGYADAETGQLFYHLSQDSMAGLVTIGVVLMVSGTAFVAGGILASVSNRTCFPLASTR